MEAGRAPLPAGSEPPVRPAGCTVVLENRAAGQPELFRETALPFAGSSWRPPEEPVPERICRMRQLYRYGGDSLAARARNFYRQGMFMRDYEDDAPFPEDFISYFPTYHDLNTRQLRGYFAWRTLVRRGEYRPVALSVAYLYIYELLNGIGTASPEEGLLKMTDFRKGFLEAGFGDARLKQNLSRWMMEFAVIRNLPPVLARQAADPELLETDAALAALDEAEAWPDEEVFAALRLLSGKKALCAPLLGKEPERTRQLIASSWRLAAREYRQGGRDLFALCFGTRSPKPWSPLSNAVYYRQEEPAEGQCCELDECRRFVFRGGRWLQEAFDPAAFSRERLRSFLREAEALLRPYLKAGRPLAEKEEDRWAAPFIRAVIGEDRKARAEAARPKIELDLSGLEMIRRDALSTQNSLLTEEEKEEAGPAVRIPEEPETAQSSLPLDGTDIRILKTLLAGGSVLPILKETHRLPSLAADRINEALYEEIGDSALSCEDGTLRLLEDYTEEISRLLEGSPL